MLIKRTALILTCLFLSPSVLAANDREVKLLNASPGAAILNAGRVMSVTYQICRNTNKCNDAKTITLIGGTFGTIAFANIINNDSIANNSSNSDNSINGNTFINSNSNSNNLNSTRNSNNTFTNSFSTTLSPNSNITPSLKITRVVETEFGREIARAQPVDGVVCTLPLGRKNVIVFSNYLTPRVICTLGS